LLAIDLGLGPEPELVLMAYPFPAFALVEGTWRHIGQFNFDGALKPDELVALMRRGDVRPATRVWNDLRLGDRKGTLILRQDRSGD
jgi:hypothetical protein